MKNCKLFEHCIKSFLKVFIMLFLFCVQANKASAQRMLILQDTPRFANQNQGVWVLRLADRTAWYSNGIKWIQNTGGLGPQTISDSLAAFSQKIVTSFNGKRGAVKGIDSMYFNTIGDTIYWRYNSTILKKGFNFNSSGVSYYGLNNTLDSTILTTNDGSRFAVKYNTPTIYTAGYGITLLSNVITADTAGVNGLVSKQRLANSLALKVNVSDTLLMLQPYVNDAGYGLIKTGQSLKVDSTKIKTVVQATVDSLALVAAIDNKVTIGGDSKGVPIVIGTNDNFPFTLKTNNIVRATISNTGNVGIGTSISDSTLTVNGGVQFKKVFQSTDITDSVVVVNSSGGIGKRLYSDIFKIITKTQADALISTNALDAGKVYQITGFNNTLYNDGTNSGTSIIVKAVANNKFESFGTGIFYNPKYTTNTDGYGIWHNINILNANRPGVQDAPLFFLGGEVITANNGATGICYGLGSIAGTAVAPTTGRLYFTATSGVWDNTVTSITGTTSLATTTIASTALKTYTIGQKVQWGGYMWANVNGNVGASTSITQLNAEWSLIPYSTTEYNIAYDEITIDFANNKITSRKDEKGNIVSTQVSNGIGNIAWFAWGHPLVNHNIVDNSVCAINNVMGEVSYNTIIERSAFSVFMYTGYNETNPSFYNSCNYNTVKSQSNIVNNNLLEAVKMTNNIVSDGATIQDNWAINFATISFNTLKEGTGNQIRANQNRRGTINNNTLRRNSTINFNTIYNSGHVLSNFLEDVSSIYNNTFKNNYFQAVASDRAFISSNKLNQSDINSNTLNVLFNKRSLYIGSNTLLGEIGQDNQYRKSFINSCIISGMNTKLILNELRVSNIISLNINGVNGNRDYRNNRLSDIVLDYSSTPSNAKLVNAIITDDEQTITFTKVFNGGTGEGLVGQVNLPPILINVGFFIKEVIVDASFLTSTTNNAIINLGIEANNTQSGINNTNGLISTLNANGISIISQYPFTKAAPTGNVVMNISGENITSGSATFKIKLMKINFQ